MMNRKVLVAQWHESSVMFAADAFCQFSAILHQVVEPVDREIDQVRILVVQLQFLVEFQFRRDGGLTFIVTGDHLRNSSSHPENPFTDRCVKILYREQSDIRPCISSSVVAHGQTPHRPSMASQSGPLAIV
jgi:hypothetical protein